MIFTTLTYNGVEKTLADWIISSHKLTWTSQIEQRLDFVMPVAADAPDPFPYRAKIILQAGRTVPASKLPPNGDPPTGLVNAFSGGKIIYIGYLPARGRRSASGAHEQISFKFVDPFTFCFGRLSFRMPRQSATDVAGSPVQIIVNDPEVILGFAANFDFSEMNYLSLHQQLIFIANWAIAGSVREFGSAQFQFDSLAHAIDGTNWDLDAPSGGNVNGVTANCSIPDYVPGTYGAIGASGPSLGTCANPDGLVLRCALDGVNNISCSEAFRRTLRAVGGTGNCGVWFDYTTTPPTLKVFTRDSMPAKTVPFIGNVVDADIQARDDLVPTAVDLQYHVNVTIGGNTYMQSVRDIAGTVSGVFVEGIGNPGALTTLTGGSIASGTQTSLVALGEGTQSIASTVDIDGGSISGTTETSTIKCLPLSLGDPFGQGTSGADRICWEWLNKSFQDVLAPSGNTTLKLLTGPTYTDRTTGASVSISGFSYLLTEGSVASWMVDGSTVGQSLDIVVQASFSYTGKNNSVMGSHAFRVNATVTNLPGDPTGTTYTGTNFTSFSAGELPPYGLAGYIYNQQKVLQYAGSYRFVEQDITASFQPGSLLNLSGGRPEWATMNAFVKQIEYDFASGMTRLQFGPRDFLAAQDLMDNIRRDRGPRGVTFFNSNILNTV